ncbi:hypothetical protein KSP39_PZI008714 [Platanthera zijinensis]|uniref:Uncharacterized protein n=3 Tax=Platanthera TaxID=59352 RepID=A0AAP0BMH3_9ASPA
MCRPSQTPHLTMSSARIDPPEQVLKAKRRSQAPPPSHGIILSRLFDARGRPQRGHSQPVPQPARDDPLSPRMQLKQSADSRWVQDWDPRAQSSEPILFPKLRIHFADFPCLHCSIDQRLFTLET